MHTWRQFDHTTQPVAACLPPNNLSAPRTGMVGRERETEKICGELRCEGARLVTLTGVGGTRKTTLAHAVARRLLRDFLRRCFLCRTRRHQTSRSGRVYHGAVAGREGG